MKTEKNASHEKNVAIAKFFSYLISPPFVVVDFCHWLLDEGLEDVHGAFCSLLEVFCFVSPPSGSGVEPKPFSSFHFLKIIFFFILLYINDCSLFFLLPFFFLFIELSRYIICETFRIGERQI